jgi:hypothetical protein
MHSLHGKIAFRVQQYCYPEGGGYQNYFTLTGQFQHGYISERLEELTSWLATRQSYETVEETVERMVGERLLSDQTIHDVVVKNARDLSARQQQQVNGMADRELPAINRQVVLYDATVQEVLFFEDGIQVKAQKEQRDRQPRGPDELKRVNTDVGVLELPGGSYWVLTAGFPGEHTLPEAVRAAFCEHYADTAAPINLVAITDGARSIRTDLEASFDGEVTCILDWYHLRKKVNELLSMICSAKAEREQHAAKLLNFCWEGKITQGIEYVTHLEQVRNHSKHQELVTYLTKHQAEIIDYHQRQRVGKSIGSGRSESVVNQVVGRRQKHHGMSWSSEGSRALAILTSVQLNQTWKTMWTFYDKTATT